MITQREKIQITKLSDQGKSNDLETTTSAQRLGMIYQLVIDAWAFKGGRLLNPDFRDMLSAFSDERVEFMVVGAFALAAHGVVRATGDIDLWIQRSAENADRVLRALVRFGAPVSTINRDDLQAPDTVLQIGVAPSRVDILTSIDGLDFADAEPNREYIQVEELLIPVIGRADLIANKKATGRPQDRADVELLEASRTRRFESLKKTP